MNNLIDGSGSADRLNSSFFLQTGVTVFDDDDRDHMTGSSEKDWIISFDSDNDNWWRWWNCCRSGIWASTANEGCRLITKYN